MVEQPAVNRFVVGSSPTRGAERGGASSSDLGVNARPREDHLPGFLFSPHPRAGPGSPPSLQPGAGDAPVAPGSRVVHDNSGSSPRLRGTRPLTMRLLENP